MNKKLLSICIPTYKREAIVKKLLTSIYSQNVDHSLFEVCITDNSDTDETKELIDAEFSALDNLHYKKVTCKGFYNSIEALKSGNGLFLKLHNDYSIFQPGALQQMINVIRRAEKDRAQIFFSMGSLRNLRRVTSFKSYNRFMNNISFWATWSSGFSVWKDDFDKIINSGIVPNYMYPHTTLLHQLTNKPLYLVDNSKYVNNIEPEKKGGYNLIDNFVRIYLTMVKTELIERQYISKKTYTKIENGILKFCADWYYRVKKDGDRYTFTFEEDKQIIRRQCGAVGNIKYDIWKSYSAIKHTMKSIILRRK